MDSDDFEYQLQCERLEKQQQEKSVPVVSSLKEATGTYVDPKDGTVFEWDDVKKAWFPKIDDNFLAFYQASYGTYDSAAAEASAEAAKKRAIAQLDNSDEDEGMKKPEPKPANPKKSKQERSEGFVTVQKAEQQKALKKKQEPAAWFEVDDEHNRNVYVSNLPSEVSTEEFVELMSKCGILMKDPRTDAFKVKIYKDAEGHCKGDALCTYMKVESIPLALQILDGSTFKGKEITVERAKFQLKGNFDPEKAKQQKLKKNEKKRLQKAQEKLLGWRPDKLPGTRPKNEKVVVIKNMFDPKEFEEDPSLILEFKQDLQIECGKFGDVKKVIVYDRHPDGVATVGFATHEQADACVSRMNGRWFDKRQLSASLWDGKEKFKIQESEEEEKKRLSQWEKFLGEAPAAENTVASTTSSSSS